MNVLESVIPIGKENAIHNVDLANKLGVTPAAAKKLVKKARQEEGLQILSGQCGYWFPENEEETIKFVKSMIKQAVSRFKSIKWIRRALKEIEGQISLSDVFTEVFEEEGNEKYE